MAVLDVVLPRILEFLGLRVWTQPAGCVARRGDQLVERIGQVADVGLVALDLLAKRAELGLGDLPLAALLVADDLAAEHGEQRADQHDHHHQFDERETLSRRPAR